VSSSKTTKKSKKLTYFELFDKEAQTRREVHKRKERKFKEQQRLG